MCIYIYIYIYNEIVLLSKVILSVSYGRVKLSQGLVWILLFLPAFLAVITVKQMF